MSDRLKTCLAPDPLNYVLSLEDDDWFTPDRVATLSDINENNHQSTAVFSRGRDQGRVAANNVNARVNNTNDRRPDQFVNSYRGGSHAPVKLCYRCQLLLHLARA